MYTKLYYITVGDTYLKLTLIKQFIKTPFFLKNVINLVKFALLNDKLNFPF